MKTQDIFLNATRCPMGAFSLLTVALSISLSREIAVAADKAGLRIMRYTHEKGLSWSDRHAATVAPDFNAWESVSLGPTFRKPRT